MKTASFVLANNGRTAYWSRASDSHEDIITEHGLVDCVRVVFTPHGADFSAPMDEWTLGLDQDQVPSWYDPKQARKAVMAAWDEYRAARFAFDGERTVTNNDFVIAYGYATVHAYGSAKVEAYGSALVHAYDDATVRAHGYATVEAYDDATVEAYGDATVEAYGYATVEAYGSATVRAYCSTTVRAYGDATVRSYDAATVRVYGFATARAYGSATVEAYGDATVIRWSKNSIVGVHNGAVLIDRTGNKPICVTAEDRTS